MAVNTWGAVNTWEAGGNSASVALTVPAPVFSVSGGLGLSASVAFALDAPVFSVSGGAVTDYPIASISFIIDKPSFKDNLYSNSFGIGFNKSSVFNSGVIKINTFNGVTK